MGGGGGWWVWCVGGWGKWRYVQGGRMGERRKKKKSVVWGWGKGGGEGRMKWEIKGCVDRA